MNDESEEGSLFGYPNGFVLSISPELSEISKKLLSAVGRSNFYGC